MKDGAEGRHFEEAHVGVPAAAKVYLLGGLLDDLEDLRVARHALHIGMDVERAPALAEGDVLVGREGLVAEEDDVVLEEGLVDVVELRVGERLRQVHAFDLGAEMGREGLDGDGLEACCVGHDQPSWARFLVARTIAPR